MLTFRKPSLLTLILLLLTLTAINCGSFKSHKPPHKATNSENLDSKLIVNRQLRKSSEGASSTTTSTYNTSRHATFEQNDLLKHKGHHNISYVGDAKSYIDNPAYAISAEKVVVDSDQTEHVTLFVKARVESLTQPRSVAIIAYIAIAVLIAIEFKNWAKKFFQDEILKSLNAILR